MYLVEGIPKVLSYGEKRRILAHANSRYSQAIFVRG
jgi:hypothetical protein